MPPITSYIVPTEHANQTRAALLRHIAARVAARQGRGAPALSVDTKKEVLGNLKNAGRTYRPKGNPETVKRHDFPDRELGKAVPDGVYDIHGNEAGVSVGISHDTAECAVAAIHCWWEDLGCARYGRVKPVTADAAAATARVAACGKSNCRSGRTRWV